MKKKICIWGLILSIIACMLPAGVMADSSLKIGDYLQMGTYYGEPIIWRCVDIDDKGPLMLSDKIICMKAWDAAGTAVTGSHGRGQAKNNVDGGYRQECGSNYWGDSNIRDWLNSDAAAGKVVWTCGNAPTADKVWSKYNAYDQEAGFLTNFNGIERTAVKTVTQKSLLDRFEYSSTAVTNYHKYKNSIETVLQNYDTAYSETTTDSMFFLDVKQLHDIYDKSDVLGENYYIGEPTAKAVENCQYKYDTLAEGSKWYSWLRSPVCYNSEYDCVRDVHQNGTIHNIRPYYSYVGVRPAFYLNLSDAIAIEGSGSTENPYVVKEPVKTYTVVFKNGDEIIDTQTVEEGGSAIEPAAPVKEGYIFKGWDKEFTNVTEDLEINAIFEEEPIPVKTYTVVFKNGDEIIDTQTVEEGGSATEPAAPVKEGYIFKGWDKEFTNVTEDLEINAIFEEEPIPVKTYTVVFKNGDEIIDTQTVEEGDSATEPTTPVKEGYIFKGWDKEFTNITENLEINAVFVKTYTVVFKNGDEIIDTQTVEEGSSATEPAAPVKDGYIFKGWDKEFTNVTEDLEINAIFEEEPVPVKTYTVVFKNGDEIIDTQIVEEGSSAIEPAAPVKDGYIFKGWDKEFTNVTEDLEINAIFEKEPEPAKKYTVVFKCGDEVIDTQTVEEGKAAKAPAVPYKDGFRFSGWDMDITSITSDRTVSAVYTIADSKIDVIEIIGIEGYSSNININSINELNTLLDKLLKVRMADGTILFMPAKWNEVADVEEGKKYVMSGTLISENESNVSIPENTDLNFDIYVESPAENAHIVKFMSDGKLISIQEVTDSKAAAAPENPTKSGFVFKGWDKDFSSVTADLTINAVFEKINADKTVKVGKAMAQSGEIVTVSVTADKGINMTHGSFIIQYDRSKMVLESSEAGELLNNKNVTVNPDYNNQGATGTTNDIYVSFMGSESVSDGGVLINLTFRINEETENDYTIPLTVTEMNLYGSDMTKIEVMAESGEIHILNYTLGDVNDDGVIDINDAYMALLFDLKLTEPTASQKMAADVNGDGAVDIFDAWTIQKYAARLITSLSGE